MASISTLRVFLNTQVIPAVEAAPAISSVSTSGDRSGYAAGNRQTGASRDEAQLSATGTVLARALNASDVRLDKVVALQRAIANGTYSVSSDVLAEWLIQSLAA